MIFSNSWLSIGIIILLLPQMSLNWVCETWQRVGLIQSPLSVFQNFNNKMTKVLIQICRRNFNQISFLQTKWFLIEWTQQSFLPTSELVCLLYNWGFLALQQKYKLLQWFDVLFNFCCVFGLINIAKGEFGSDMAQAILQRTGNETIYWISAGMRSQCIMESWE